MDYGNMFLFLGTPMYVLMSSYQQESSNGLGTWPSTAPETLLVWKHHLFWAPPSSSWIKSESKTQAHSGQSFPMGFYQT
jgi:hypothetical protein